MSRIIFNDFLKKYQKQKPINIFETEIDSTYQKDFDIFSKIKINNPLTEIYADFKKSGFLTSRNGVGITIITPEQTVSSLLDPEHFFHEQTIRIIDNLIYRDSFYKDYKKQNIEIRYCFNDESLLILLEVPIPINSSQKEELKKINYQLKEFKKQVGIEANVCYSIVPGRLKYRNIKPIINYNIDYDLDNLLNLVIVDDSFVPNYCDKFLVGTLHKNAEESADYSYAELKDLFCEYLISLIDYFDEKLEDLRWFGYLENEKIYKCASDICSKVDVVLLEIEKNNYLFENENDIKKYLNIFNNIKKEELNYIVEQKKSMKK